jgi:hypothetical protein
MSVAALLWLQNKEVNLINYLRDSSVGIALGYGLDDRGPRFRFPAGAGNFSLFTTASRTALGPTKPPVQWVKRALSLGVKLTTHLHLVPRSKLYFHSPNTPSWRCAQLKHRDNFTFTFISCSGYHMKCLGYYKCFNSCLVLNCCEDSI